MDDARPDGGVFAAIAAKLTVFALANGVDLAKSEDHRRLEWYSDGFERGILVATDGAGFGLALLKWKSGQADDAEPHPFRDGVPAGEVRKLLDEAINAANAL